METTTPIRDLLTVRALVTERTGNGDRCVKKGGGNSRRHCEGLAKVSRTGLTPSKTPSSRKDAEIFNTHGATVIRRQNVKVGDPTGFGHVNVMAFNAKHIHDDI